MPKKEKIPAVVIQRNRWRCGGSQDSGSKRDSSHGNGPTELLNTRGFKCCLGFACSQLGGIANRDMLCYTSPEAIIEGRRQEGVIPHLTTESGKNTLLSKVAMWINDDSDLSRYAREDALCTVFEMAGIKLTFEGDYNK